MSKWAISLVNDGQRVATRCVGGGWAEYPGKGGKGDGKAGKGDGKAGKGDAKGGGGEGWKGFHSGVVVVVLLGRVTVGFLGDFLLGGGLIFFVNVYR